jgi:trehalose 6-phosphate phosphatase
VDSVDGITSPVDGSELVSALRDDPAGTLLALDFDGTLAPIVPDPEDSRPADGALAVLHRLADRGVQLAVITGRDARTVLRLGGLQDLPRLTVEGLYGAERWHDGELETLDTPESMVRLRDELPRVVERHAGDPDVWIEDKRLSLVVHGRLSADPEAALDPLREPVARLAADLGLEQHPGRGVLELRLPGYDKGAALQRLVDRYRPRVVAFAGDDVGDLPALELVRTLRADGRRAFAVAISSTEAREVTDAADVTLADPGELVALLARAAS